MRQGLGLEPLLQAISDFLDDQQDMIEQIRIDLVRGLKNAETGRSGLTPQQVLRSLVLMRGKNWNCGSKSPTDIRCASSRTSILGGCRGMMHPTAASPD